MAAATGPRDSGRKSATKEGDLVAHKVAAGVKIFKETMVFLNAAGYLIPARSTTSTDTFCGIAYEGFDNSGGADGAASSAVYGLSKYKTECRVWKDGSYVFPKATAAQADVGEEVYASDDQTLTLTATTGGQKVGVVVGAETISGQPSTTTVRIRIDNYVK